jgi:hypothetical protein
MRWTFGEWTSVSQRIVREVNQRFLMESPEATATGHYLYNDPGDSNREYHLGLTAGAQTCQLVDYLGAVRSTTDNSGTITSTPDATRQYAVPSVITANGYSTSMQCDGLLNLAQATGPNSATTSFGYDVASRPTSTQGVDGDSVNYTYSTPGRYSTATSGKRFTQTSVDDLGRTVKVETGYNRLGFDPAKVDNGTIVSGAITSKLDKDCFQ